MGGGDPGATRRMLLVLGMHRSGTSALAGALSTLGVDFSGHLIPPRPDNPKGYFEHAEIWDLDHSLLRSIGSEWDDPLPLPPGWNRSSAVADAAARALTVLARDFARSCVNGIKDPRMCRLLPAWRLWLEAAGFHTSAILSVREPASVCASLAARDRLTVERAAWMWLRHVIEAERGSRGLARVVVSYESLLDDWRKQFGRVATALDIAWPRDPDTAGPAVDAFLEVGLSHHAGQPDTLSLHEPLRGWVTQVRRALERAARDDTAGLGNDLDAVATAMAQADDELGALRKTVLRETRHHGFEVEKNLQWSEQEREKLVAGYQELKQVVDVSGVERDKLTGENVTLQANLQHSEREREGLASQVQQLQQAGQRAAESLAGLRAVSGELRENLAWHLREQGRIQHNLSLCEHERERLATQTDELKARNSALSAAVAAVYASRSWRVTRPLRGVSRLLRGDRHQSRKRANGAARPSSAPDAEAGALMPSSAAKPGVTAPTPVSGAESATAPIRVGPETGTGDPAPTQSADAVDPDVDVAAVDATLAAAFAKATGPRILIVTPDVVGPIRNGGIGTAFTALAETLAGAGHAVTVAYTLGGYTEDGDDIARWRQDYARRGIHFVPLWLERGEPKLDAPHYAWRSYRVYLWLNAHQADYDLAYFPEWRGEAYYALQAKQVGSAFAQLRMVVVTHSSTTWADSGNYLLPARFDEILLEYLERRCVELADAVVSPSQYMLDWMHSWGWQRSGPTHVIQNLMPAMSGEPPRAADHAAVTEWVFFGRLERRKGLLVFLAALAQMPADIRAKIQVTFLGKAIHTPDFDSEAAIRQRFDDWARPPKLIVDYDRDRALAYLAEPGRVAIVASLVENSPYTVLECLAVGVPFIAADVGGIGELIHPDDRERILFKPDPAALARTLRRLQDGQCRRPQPAISFADTRTRWLALQGQLLREIPEPDTPATPQPHVTVCLVHYDRPQFLVQALDSLRGQSYRDFDVVLVDDGSPSAAARRCLDELEPEFVERGWTLLRQANRYLGAARNHAARHARGDYVLFMDDDNLAKPDELASFARAAQVTGADILTTVSDIFFSDEPFPEPGRPSRELWIPLGGAVGLGVFRNVFGDANALIRRETFLDLGGFTEDYGVGHEDWEFFARAVLAGATLQLVPEPLFWYRVDSDSMLRGGDQSLDLARSLRPYRKHVGRGIGAALAYAAHLHHHEQLPAPGWLSRARPAASAQVVSGPQSAALLRVSLGRRVWFVATGVFRPAVRARFRQVLRESGWRALPGRIAHYIRRSARDRS